MSVCVEPKSQVGNAPRHVLLLVSGLMLVVQTSAHATDHGNNGRRLRMKPLDGWSHRGPAPYYPRLFFASGAKSRQRNGTKLAEKNPTGPSKSVVRRRKGDRGHYEVFRADSLDAKGRDELVALEGKAFPKAPWTRDRLEEYSHLATVLKSKGKIVGYVFLVDPATDHYETLHGPPFDRSEPSHLYVAHLAVHPDLQKNGLGRELMAMAFEQAQYSGKTRIVLHVRATNGARKFYKMRGFREGRTLEKVYPNELKGRAEMEDALEMWKPTGLVPGSRDGQTPLHHFLGPALVPHVTSDETDSIPREPAHDL